MGKSLSTDRGTPGLAPHGGPSHPGVQGSPRLLRKSLVPSLALFMLVASACLAGASATSPQPYVGTQGCLTVTSPDGSTTSFAITPFGTDVPSVDEGEALADGVVGPSVGTTAPGVQGPADGSLEGPVAFLGGVVWGAFDATPARLSRAIAAGTPTLDDLLPGSPHVPVAVEASADVRFVDTSRAFHPSSVGSRLGASTYQDDDVQGGHVASAGTAFAATPLSAPRTPYAPPVPGGTTPWPSHSGKTRTQGSSTLAHDPLGNLGISGGTASLAAAALGLLPLLAWGLYHRVRNRGLLKNGTRRRIFEAVAEEPGRGVQALADAAGVSYSTTAYHLGRLLEARMLVESRQGNRRRYFLNGGTFNEEERRTLHVLGKDETMRVLLDILDHPRTYRAEVAERLGVSTTTVNWHLRGLLDTGFVHEVRDGRCAFLHVDPASLRARVTPLLQKAQEEGVGVPVGPTVVAKLLKPTVLRGQVGTKDINPVSR